MHYEIYPPFPSFGEMAVAVLKTAAGLGGPGLSADEKGVINHDSYDMHHKGFDEHGAYWSDTHVLSGLRKDLQ